MSELSTSKYPVSEHFKVLDGYDIYRSNNLIIALVAVEANNRKDLRLYRWQNRQGNWKVDLCRMSVTRWQWDSLAEKAKELTNKYELGETSTQDKHTHPTNPNNLMEDTATVEICKAQNCQRIHHSSKLLDGSTITRELFRSMLREET